MKSHEAVVLSYTDVKVSADCTVDVEPRIVTEREFSTLNRRLHVFERILVVLTLATWYAADGALAIQIRNPSSEYMPLPRALVLGTLSTVPVESLEQLYANAVVALPRTVADVKRRNLNCVNHHHPLSWTLPLRLSSKPPFLTREVGAVRLSLSAKRLGKCTVAEATLPLPSD